VFSPQRHLREMPEPIADEREPLQTEAGATAPGVVDPWDEDVWTPADETPR
jgi:hypothetical protein